MLDLTLKDLFIQSISNGLKQKALTVCSKWSCENRVMGPPFPGKFSFKYHPWLRKIHDSEASVIVAQKCAQVGFTECALNKTFFKIAVERIDCLYLLPSADDVTDLSSSRFDVALELSESLSTLFSDVKNVGHKRAGTANLFLRGSRSRSKLKSIPVGFIVFDELDEMDQKNVPLAMERMSGQKKTQCMKLSTATIEDYGINAEYKVSTQDHFMFKCPSCSRQTELVFPDCLEITAERITDPRVSESRFLCKECKNTLHHEQKPEFLASGIWVPTFPDRDVEGYEINQLYSSAAAGRPDNLAKAFLASQDNPAKEQEFYNSKLGKTREVSGARVTDTDINSCTASHSMGPLNYSTLITMGCDIGRWLHVEIDEWIIDKNAKTPDINAIAIPKVIYADKVLDFEHLIVLFQQYNVMHCLVDAQPERRKAYEFCSRFPGRASMCFYGRGITGKQLNLAAENHGEPSVTVDRTSWLDIALSRFRTKRIALPINTLQEYRTHMKNIVRVYQEDDNGNPIGKYVSTGDDHFAHARNYAEIALALALNSGIPTSITRGVL